MPVDYSPLNQLAGGVDVGNAMARAAQIQGIRQSNLLAQAQLDDFRRGDQFRNALAGGAPDEELQGIDPDAFQRYRTGQNALAQSGNQGRVLAAQAGSAELAAQQEKAGYLHRILGTIKGVFDTKGDEAGMQMAKALWPEVKQKGFFPGLDAVPNDPAGVRNAVDQFYSHTQAVMVPKEAPAPLSTQGKLVADFENGYLSDEDFRGGMGKANYQRPPDSIVVDARQPYESASNKALAKLDADDYNKSQDEATSASEELASLDSIRNNPAITGPTQDFRASLTSLFADFGVPLSPAKVQQVSNLAGYKAAVSDLASISLRLNNGVQTEGDDKRVRQSLASTTNLKDANNVVMDYRASQLERRQEMADFAVQYRMETGSIDGWRAAWRKHIGRTPLALPNKSGRLWFVNDFVKRRQAENPNMSRDEILEEWRSLRR